MKEIRIHGRGGQGSVTAAELIAMAAFEDGKYSQALPAFGVERRGAPVAAYVRLDDKPIRIRNQINFPDYVIVQDPTLIEVINVTGGLKIGGSILINSEKNPDYFAKKIGIEKNHATIHTIDATRIALEYLGRPIVNTVLLGAFAAASGEISASSLQRAALERFPGKLGEKNSHAIAITYEKMKEKEGS